MEWLQKYWIFGLGFAAQFLFAIRLVTQWIQSEQEGKVLSPVIFWQVSLIAGFMFLVYGIFRDDVVIIAGQIPSIIIYIRNLQLKNAWKKISILFRFSVIVLPFIAVAWITFGSTHGWQDLVSNNEFTNPLLILGGIGQVLLSFRFVYQWYYSEKMKASVLPLGFWIISVVGSALVIIYAVYRRDPVLFLASCLGLFIYFRNILIEKRSPSDVL
ncbi:MAG TPA: lipid-A-disaccharide synthase N-terminal domain-containing protein [Cyclobacteriaceae bacterium]|nr:lipid-A-disaccharide synthase N-terminal domain-containing protein [Cyclobacteriaceae bacterium]